MEEDINERRSVGGRASMGGHLQGGRTSMGAEQEGCSKGTEVSDSIMRSHRGWATSAPLPWLSKCLFFPFPGELRKT